MIVLATGALTLTSCSKTDDTPVGQTVVPPNDDDSGNTKDDGTDTKDDDTDTPDDSDKVAMKPYITDTVVYAKYPLLRNLNLFLTLVGQWLRDSYLIQ